MAAPSPSLSLSDIMHPFSPPPMPIPHTSSSPPPRPKSSTPEPLEPAEIEEMRRKVVGMGWSTSSKGKEKAGSREQELADMLLRLTHPASLPQPPQFHAQAETIAHLIQQRDFLAKRSMEERERWESEKEGWTRAAQALIIQGRRNSAQTEKDEAIAAQYALVTTDASTQRMQEFERANAVLQNDKKIIQQKLTDTQIRLASLESELAQLKPLLLMQPFALTHSHPTGTARGLPASSPNTSTQAASRRQKDREHRQEDVDVEIEDDTKLGDEPPTPQLQPRHQFRNPVLRPLTREQPSLQPAMPTSPYKSKGDYYRRRDSPASTIHYPSAQYANTGRRKGGAVQSFLNKTTLSDARAEHLLLAARKIGRQRASALSGVFAHVQQPSEPLSHNKHKPPSSPSKAQTQPPKTPRRNANANAKTPLLTRTPLGQTGTPSAQPRTPLQSLLSAAQSVLSVPGAASSSNVETPLAKRRKLDHTFTVVKSADTPQAVRQEREKEKKEKASLSGGVARVKSALDFLADQAEVYSTQPASQDSMGEGDSPPKDGEDSLPLDIDMGDATQPADEAGPDAVTRLQKGEAKGKERAGEMSMSRVGSPSERHFDQPVLDDEETQQTTVGRVSRGTTPSASMGMLGAPSTSFNVTDPNQFQQPETDRGPSEALSAPLTLAPPINLTPRVSRSPGSSPAPAGLHSNPRKRSRSQSSGCSPPRALSAPALETVSGSFSMFSLQRPQPVAPTPGGGPSILHTSLSGETLEHEHNPNGGMTSRLVEGIKFISDGPPRRTRSPYIKWTKDEDELLAKAVAKYGQKWDLVQKALPSRGYHQVRQRWLRKLGVFDNSKLDLSSLETNAAAEFLNISTAPPTEGDSGPFSESRLTANPKLGLAPLNSEKALTGPSSLNPNGARSVSPAATIELTAPFATGSSNVQVGRSSSWPASGHGEGG